MYIEGYFAEIYSIVLLPAFLKICVTLYIGVLWLHTGFRLFAFLQ